MGFLTSISPDEWRTIGAVVGAASGVAALGWNVSRALIDRRPRVRVVATVTKEDDWCSVSVLVVNVGQTVETVREIGVGWAHSHEPISTKHRRVGTRSGVETALADIAVAIRSTADGQGMGPSLMPKMLSHRPGRQVWPLPPGGLAEAGFGLVKPDGTFITGTMRAYALLASGKTVRSSVAVVEP